MGESPELPQLFSFNLFPIKVKWSFGNGIEMEKKGPSLSIDFLPSNHFLLAKLVLVFPVSHNKENNININSLNSTEFHKRDS